MKSSVVSMFAVAALVATLAAQVNADIVSVSDPNNVAPLAAMVESSWIGPDYPFSAPAKAIDGRVSNASDPYTADREDEGSSFLFNDNMVPNTITLTWSQPQHLTSLQAYVCTGSEGNFDRAVYRIDFSVKQGVGAFTEVGQLEVPDTNDIGVFDLTGLNGDWSNVTAVQYKFNGWDGVSGPRVAEVLAIAVPEPSALMLLGAGVISLLAYAWRKQR